MGEPQPFFPGGLSLLRLRLTLRLLEDALLPAEKGAMLRGGFGYAFQRASCPQVCWGRQGGCAVGELCPFRWIFATPRPPGIEHFHDLRDIPRPFVIEPPTDGRREYRAGEALEFGLTIIGRAIEHLPYFLFSFEHLGQMGLGRLNARFRLERVEALLPWQPFGTVIYQDGRAMAQTGTLPLTDAQAIVARAALLPSDLALSLNTPMQLKVRGDFARTLDLPGIVQAICWRWHTLSIFHGGGPWPVDHRPLMEEAADVVIERPQVRWIELLRTSTRGAQPKTMPHGGLVGCAVLRGLTPTLRAVLLAGSLVHLGKSCTFGHGGIELRRV